MIVNPTPKVTRLHTPPTLKVVALAVVAFAISLSAHDIITTSITFDKEIVRIIHSRCARCHHDGGSAFSLMTYKEARPWAQAIKEEILSRRMPPWGAVKGFGEFRNDEGLSNEQVETVVGWIDGGAPEGEESTLPHAPTFPASPKETIQSKIAVPPRALVLTSPAPRPVSSRPRTQALTSTEPRPVGSGLSTPKPQVLLKPITLDGLLPLTFPKGASLQITATLPDGTIEPLLWLDTYQEKFPHSFLLEKPFPLPAGTQINGLVPGTKIALLPAKIPAANK